MSKVSGFPPIQTRYLNPQNPDVQMYYWAYKQNNGIALWEPLTLGQLEEFEMDILARLPVLQRGRTYLYPFFLNPNKNDEVNRAYRSFFTCRRTPSDDNRDEFERQFAAGKVREYYGSDRKRDSAPAPAVSGAVQLSLYSAHICPASRTHSEDQAV